MEHVLESDWCYSGTSHTYKYSTYIHIIMAREPTFQKTMNLSIQTMEQIKELRPEYGTDTAVVSEGVALLHRTLKNRPGNEDLIRGV